MSAASSSRQPWSMKWIVLAIVVSLILYTYLTLHFRKAGPAFRPYADIKDHANTVRLLDAGYQRITLKAELPVDPVSPGQSAPTSTALAGLPATLRHTLIDQPKLPAEIVSVSAAPSANSMCTYAIGFKCTLPDNKQQLAGADLYVRGGEIIVAPDFDRLAGGLLSRSRENLIRLTVPAGALKPGQYHVTLVGARASKAWTLQVH